MTESVLLIGAGGHAKVLLDALQRFDADIVGLLDADPALHGKAVLGVPVLGGDQMIQQYDPARVRLVNAVGSTRQPLARKSVYERFKTLGYGFKTVVHPAAIVSPHATLGEGAQIMAGAVVQAGAHIGENVLVNTAASVDHDCLIGPHVHLSPGSTLCGEVRVGEASHIGAGAVLIQGVAVGCFSLVGAAALVLQAVPDHATVLGVPARQRS